MKNQKAPTGVRYLSELLFYSITGRLSKPFSNSSSVGV